MAANQRADFVVEVFSDVPQQELWEVEEKLNQIEGLEADLRESKGLESLDPNTVQAAIDIAFTVVGTALAYVAKTQALTKILHGLTHSERKVVVTKKDGTRIELYGRSEDEVVKLLRDK